MYLKLTYRTVVVELNNSKNWSKFQLIKPIEKTNNTPEYSDSYSVLNNFSEAGMIIERYLKFDFDIDETLLKQIDQRFKLFEAKTAQGLRHAVEKYTINLHNNYEREKLRSAKICLSRHTLFSYHLPKDIQDIILGFACEEQKLLTEDIKRKLR